MLGNMRSCVCFLFVITVEFSVLQVELIGKVTTQTQKFHPSTHEFAVREHQLPTATYCVARVYGTHDRVVDYFSDNEVLRNQNHGHSKVM